MAILSPLLSLVSFSDIQTTINEATAMSNEATTSLVETTGLVKENPLTVFSTITVVDCTFFWLSIHRAPE